MKTAIELKRNRNREKLKSVAWKILHSHVVARIEWHRTNYGLLSNISQEKKNAIPIGGN